MVGNRLLLTAVNEDIARDLEFDVRLSGGQVRKVSGQRLWSADVRDHNTFEGPERMTPATLKIDVKANELRIQLPAHSISAFELEL